METLLEHTRLTEGASYLVALSFAFGFIGFWRYLTGRERVAVAPAHSPSLIAEMVQGFAVPANIFRHSGHGWAALQPDGLVRIGVDDFMPRAIGRLDAVNLPRPGDTVVAGRPAFSLVQGERRADIPAPLSGVVTEINPALAAGPAAIKDHPFDAGWVARVRPAALGEELGRLHVAERATAWIRQEAARLRDFLLAHTPNREAALGYTMADGGVPAAGSLETLDDEAWKEFMGNDGN